jgi:hypothetical protein
VVLVHATDEPEPCAWMTELGGAAFAAYGLQGPVSTVIDGHRIGPGAERWRNAEAVYEANRELVLAELREASPYTLSLAATLGEDGVVRGTLRVDGPASESARVQVVLAERGVLYPGKAGVVVWRMVARGSLLGPAAGVPYEPVDGGRTIEFARSLAEISAENVRFLERTEAAGGNAATRLSVAIDPRQVSIVAFIRDAAQVVRQATQLDLGDIAPEGAPR